MVSLLLHDSPDIFRFVCNTKCCEFFLFHKISNGHTLVDQSCHCKRIIRRINDDTIVFFGKMLNGLRHLRPHTDYNAGCSHFNRTQLRLVTIPQNDHISRMNIILQYIRIGSRNNHFSTFKESIFTSYNHFGIQCLQNVLIGSFCRG